MKAHSKHFQPGEGPSRGLLRDCENFADGAFAALIVSCFSVGNDENPRTQAAECPLLRAGGRGEGGAGGGIVTMSGRGRVACVACPQLPCFVLWLGNDGHMWFP